MKKKDLKALAKKIAHQEYIIQHSSSAEEVKEAKETILALTGSIAFSIDDETLLEDLMALLDDLIQDYLTDMS